MIIWKVKKDTNIKAYKEYVDRRQWFYYGKNNQLNFVGGVGGVSRSSFSIVREMNV